VIAVSSKAYLHLLHSQGAKTYANYLALYVSTPDYFLNSLPADSADRGQKLPLVGMGSESLVQEKRY